jgi:hypothetical protein
MHRNTRRSGNGQQLDAPTFSIAQGSAGRFQPFRRDDDVVEKDCRLDPLAVRKTLRTSTVVHRMF